MEPLKFRNLIKQKRLEKPTLTASRNYLDITIIWTMAMKYQNILDKFKPKLSTIKSKED